MMFVSMHYDAIYRGYPTKRVLTWTTFFTIKDRMSGKWTK